MRTQIKLLLLFCLCFCSSFASAVALNPSEMEKQLQSEKRVIVYAQKHIDYGEFNKSNDLLAEAVKRYSKSDMIFALYGKSLYESGKKDLAEKYFMQALKRNADNILAQQYIEQIRQVRALSESESSQEWASILKDKIGDLIVFVLSIWLGTSLNSIWHYFSRKWRWHKAKQSYIHKDYDGVVRILESHVVDMEQDAINACLFFMLSSGQSSEQVGKILSQFVIREEDLKVLLRSLQLLEAQQS